MYQVTKESSNGAIDLTQQDLPHEQSNLEWWYFNFHFSEESNKNRKFSFVFSFFKVKSKDKPKPCHFVIYALTDHQNKKFFSSTIIDKFISEEIYTALVDSNKENNPFLIYLAQMIKENGAVLPDRVMEISLAVTNAELHAQFGDSSFRKKGDEYFLSINDPLMNIDFRLNMLSKPILHGQDGIVLSKESEMEQMYYYFLPYGEVSGSCNSEKITGTAWYDHEYSINKDAKISTADLSWLWFSIQLENKEQLSIYQIFNQDMTTPKEYVVIYIDKYGNSKTYSDFTIENQAYWKSSRTLVEYPVKWKIVIPELGAELLIDTLFHDQELPTLVANPAFYEGAIAVTYHCNKEVINGMGYVEMRNMGQNLFTNPKQLIEAASQLTLKEVEEHQLLVDRNDFGTVAVRDSILAKYINDIPYKKLYAGGLEPLRDMVLRKGKCWRSLLCFISLNAVGGNSEHFREWAGMIELIQSSTLILDDIQDNSKMRRGKQTIHELYGVDKAINSGLLGFFLFNSFLEQDKLKMSQLKDIYTTYFDISISTILGQCADVSGMQDLLFEAIERGDNHHLLNVINALHGLKTGSAGKSLAEMGAVLGGGTPEQINKLGEYAFKIGLAFQYIDDAIAYTGDERSLEEDVMSAKITLPIVLSIPQLTTQQRLWLTEVIVYKKREELAQLVSLFNEMGIIDLCIQKAKSIVAQAWDELEPHLPDSIYKAMLYYAGIYILEIHLNQKT
ncbi:MAG TPA: polyprenyl synthetase family protein [Legionella sp.]|nr:polyprenyl synthetase family protein [Legionella sp.]